MTYSAIVRDPATGSFGVAVQSHFLAVGAVVPWAAAGVGAVATQAIPGVGYGPQGLDAMRVNTSAADALQGLLAADAQAELRQVAMVDAHGDVAVHTGARCIPVAGCRTGAEWGVQGNMLDSERVLDVMAATLRDSADDDLPRRLLAVLRAAEDAGGDVRGSQAAALLVVSGVRDSQPHHQVLVDLRVDDSTTPVADLDRLLIRHEATTALGIAFGLILDDDADLSAGIVDAVAAGTRRAEAHLDAANPEAPLWRAVLLARSGRLEEARGEYLVALRRQPRLHDFGQRLAAAGFLSGAAAAATLCNSPRWVRPDE